MTLTLQAVQDKLGTWIPQVQGQYINEDWNPENEGFGAQCWDLAANWSKFLGLPVINTGYPGKWVGWAGNMVAAYPQSPEIAAAYELVQPDQQGLAGDIAVWGDSYQAYYPATHVAVLIRDANLQLLCASQNSTSSRMDNPYPKWSSGPATIQYLPRRGLIGFLRPRTGSGITYQSTTITPQEEDDMPSAAEIVDELLNRDVPRQGAGASGTTNLRALLAWYDANNAAVAQSAADRVLNTPIGRQGDGAGLGPQTSLGAVVAWFDSAVLGLAGAISQTAASSGASTEDVLAAVKKALAEGTVKVDVSVQGITEGAPSNG